VFGVTSLGILSCHASSPSHLRSQGAATMPNIVMIVAPTVFRDEEYAQPKSLLETRGASIVTASVAPCEAVGRFGLRTQATISVKDACSSLWDAVVFIGGGGAAVFFDDADAHALARAQVERGGVLAAICIAPSTLAHAGLLENVRATAFPDREEDLVAHGAVWTGEPVTVDGLVITANGPEAATAFGEAIATALGI
jgi:protease I